MNRCEECGKMFEPKKYGCKQYCDECVSNCPDVRAEAG